MTGCGFGSIYFGGAVDGEEHCGYSTHLREVLIHQKKGNYCGRFLLSKKALSSLLALLVLVNPTH